jgi:DNA-binding NarL/FixJ family response regulator
MPDTLIRLILADDHPIVLHGLESLFQSMGGFDVVARCENGEQALKVARSVAADVMVLDLRMPEKSGMDVLKQLSSDKTSVRVVLLTVGLRGAEAAEAMSLGAWGIVLKDSPPETLIECVRKVARGERWFDKGTAAGAQDAATKAAARKGTGLALTSRELEIVGMVAKGLRNRQIGEQLFISEGTVKIHLHNIYEKLGVDGRLELLLYAQEKALI